MFTSFRATLLLALAAGLSACANQPRLSGAVTPQADGSLQSSVRGPDRTAALRSFDNDAKAYCGKPGVVAALNQPGRYSVVSQTVDEKKAKEIDKSGDGRIDAGISAGMRYLKLEDKGSVEVTTVFRCQG